MSSPPEMKRASQKGQGVEVKEDDDDDDVDDDDDDDGDDDDDDHIHRQNHLKLRFQSISCPDPYSQKQIQCDASELFILLFEQVRLQKKACTTL